MKAGSGVSSSFPPPSPSSLGRLSVSIGGRLFQRGQLIEKVRVSSLIDHPQFGPVAVIQITAIITGLLPHPPENLSMGDEVDVKVAKILSGQNEEFEIILTLSKKHESVAPVQAPWVDKLPTNCLPIGMEIVPGGQGLFLSPTNTGDKRTLFLPDRLNTGSTLRPVSWMLDQRPPLPLSKIPIAVRIVRLPDNSLICCSADFPSLVAESLLGLIEKGVPFFVDPKYTVPFLSSPKDTRKIVPVQITTAQSIIRVYYAQAVLEVEVDKLDSVLEQISGGCLTVTLKAVGYQGYQDRWRAKDLIISMAQNSLRAQIVPA